jgi:hypothetical protein
MRLEQFLDQKGLVEKSPSPKKIRDRANNIKPKPIKLFYGETYDYIGNTIDSMKYYFFVSNLSNILKYEGFETNPKILVADTAASRNVSSDLKQKYMSLGNYRFDFIKEFDKIYNTGLNIIKMSDYIYSDEFQKELNLVISYCKKKPEFMSLVEKTVPPNKVDIERKNDFMYSFDEITTIKNLDIKVGPPRENLYDNIARKITISKNEKTLMSLFLTPTFPLGKDWDYFFINEGIENYGITAYKGASKRLQNFRIIIGRTDTDYACDLINKSFISQDPSLPNPVLDIGIISEMAKQKLQNISQPIGLYEQFYSKEISEKELKEKVCSDLNKYILSKF